MRNKLLRIINNYEVIPQLKYLQSEVFELNEAIIKHEFAKDDNEAQLKLCEDKKWDLDFLKNI